MRELTHRGHRTVALEPEQGWSRANLLCDQGSAAIARFGTDFPDLTVETYDAVFDHEAALSSADVVLVHALTDPELVTRFGRAGRTCPDDRASAGQGQRVS